MTHTLCGAGSLFANFTGLGRRANASELAGWISQVTVALAQPNSVRLPPGLLNNVVEEVRLIGEEGQRL